LLKSLRAYTRKFKKEIRNTESKHYKHVQAVKQDITKLQERQRLEQERYLDKKISEANEQRDYRKLKALIDSYQKEKPTPANSTISCVKDGTETIRRILRAFREYWSEIFSHDQDRLDLDDFDIDTASIGDYPEVCDAEISQEEVVCALKQLSPNKATGLDDISPAFLCDRSDELVHALTLVFNDLLRSGKFPKQWKTDRRVALYKRGGKTLVSNYRFLYFERYCAVSYTSAFVVLLNSTTLKTDSVQTDVALTTPLY